MPEKGKTGIPTLRNPNLLTDALTHKSYARANGCRDNERLELLGDSVVGLAVTSYLYRSHSYFNEGQLSRIIGVVVSADFLALAARSAGIDAKLRLSATEEASGGRKKASILSSAFEAVTGAVYLDSGMEAAQEFVLKHLESLFTQIIGNEASYDPKTAFQEAVQAKRMPTPTYQTRAANDGRFYAQALVGTKIHGAGYGTSKKSAEQSAAREALSRFSVC